MCVQNYIDMTRLLDLPDNLVAEAISLLHLADLLGLEAAVVKWERRLQIRAIVAISGRLSTDMLWWDSRSLDWALNQNVTIPRICIHRALSGSDAARFSDVFKKTSDLDFSKNRQLQQKDQLSFLCGCVTNLRELNLGDLSSSNLSMVETLASFAHNLTTLKLEQIFHWEGKDGHTKVLSAFLQKCPHLQHFHVAKLENRPDGVKAWAPYTGKLLTLDMTRGLLLGGSLEVILSYAKSLQTLDLSEIYGHTANDLIDLDTRCPNLTNMSLWGIKHFPANVLQSLVNLGPQLRTLSLACPECCGQENADIAVPELLRHCGELRELNLTFNPSAVIGSVVVPHAPTWFPHLTKLSFEFGKTRATNTSTPLEVFSALVQQDLRKLTSLNLGGTVLNDDVLVVLASKGEHLREVDISRCAQVTDAGICALVHGCPNLTKLHVGDIPACTDASLLAIAASCYWLQDLSVERNREGVTDVGVLAVAKGCKHLRAINIRGCVLVTYAAIDALLDRCRRLAEIDAAACPSIVPQKLAAALERRLWTF